MRNKYDSLKQKLANSEKVIMANICSITAP